MHRVKAIITLLTQVWSIAGEKHLGLIAAGVGFFGVFAIFPGIAAVIAIFGLIADPEIVREQLLLVEGLVPESVFGIFSQQINDLLSAQVQTLGVATFISIALAIWAARAGVGALMGGLNAIEGTPNRQGVKQIIVALALTICLVLLSIVGLLAVVIMPLVLAYVPLAASTAWLFEALRWVIVLCVLLAGLSILYRFGPNLPQRHRPILTVGAAVTIVIWIGASLGLSYYLANFASYNEIYGSLGAVIGLLLWLYVSAYLILLGAVLNKRFYAT
jgi:membrane protein